MKQDNLGIYLTAFFNPGRIRAQLTMKEDESIVSKVKSRGKYWLQSFVTIGLTTLMSSEAGMQSGYLTYLSSQLLNISPEIGLVGSAIPGLMVFALSYLGINSFLMNPLDSAVNDRR